MGVYILNGARTPFGSFMGSLAAVSAPQLAATAIKGALAKAQVSGDAVGEVILGQVIQAGVGQAPARQAVIFSGLPESVPATTVNKVCGSGLQSIILAAKGILSDGHQAAIAGGMENMSLAPFLMPEGRTGHRFGNTEIKDAMLWDGLWDVYTQRAMGNCAEECARKYQLTRQQQDQFARASFERAQAAAKAGYFAQEISAVTIKNKKGDIVVSEDEGPGKANFEKMTTLPPAFESQGTISAANASTINDGAAVVVLGGESLRAKASFEIVSWASHAQNPTWFTTAPVEAMKKALNKANVSWKDIGLYEINEAFALVTMVAMKELELSHEQVNVNGGAVALGHPIGASGARIVLSLMNTMNMRKVKYGMASICIGGGEALAMVIKNLKI